MHKFILSAFALLFMMHTASAQKIAQIEVYHGDGCPHCHDFFDWSPTLEAAYPDLKIQEFEVWKNQANKDLFTKRMAELGKVAGGVPTIVIEEEIVVGFNKTRLIELMAKHYGEAAIDLTADKPLNKQGTNPFQNLIQWIKNLFQ